MLRKYPNYPLTKNIIPEINKVPSMIDIRLKEINAVLPIVQCG